MKKTLLLILATALIAGQVHATNYKRTKSPDLLSYQLVNFPEIGIEKEVDTGESIISSADKAGFRQIKLLRDMSVNNTILWATYKYEIFASEGKAVGEVPEGMFYQFQKSKNSHFPKDKISLFVPTKNGDPFEICSSSDTIVFLCEKTEKLIEDTDYKVGIGYEFYEKSFKQELVYTGASQGVVSLVYREFKNDLARPAFSQDLKFDITTDNIVGFKGARFQIISANNTGIKYKVIQHLRRAE